jgi:hypothetical protein
MTVHKGRFSRDTANEVPTLSENIFWALPAKNSNSEYQSHTIGMVSRPSVYLPLFVNYNGTDEALNRANNPVIQPDAQAALSSIQEFRIL